MNYVKQQQTSLNNDTLLIVRFGSSTTTEQILNARRAELKNKGKSKGKLNYDKMNVIELNSVEGIKNSSDKLLMKRAFAKAGVKTATWYTTSDGKTFYQSEDKSKSVNINDLEYPIVLKSRTGSRGRGNTLCKTKEELVAAMSGKTLSNYILEKYYAYNKEYRIHANLNGYFYTCRKVLKSDTPEDKRWFRNDSNSSWLIEENEGFEKPRSFDAIVNDCVNALKHLKLDFAAFDIRVQSSKDKKGRNREFEDYILIESNSAPSFGDRTAQEYEKMITSLVK